MDWTQYAVGGATRPDSFTGMDPAFSGALERMFLAAPPAIQAQLRVGSGYRSVARQQQLWDASDKTGKMVARPGHSQHNKGYAADLKYLDDSARDWVHANAAQYGLNFPMNYEPWHIELAGVRGQTRPPDAASLINTAAQNPAEAAPSASVPMLPPPFQPSDAAQRPDLFSGSYGMGNFGQDLISGSNPLRRAVFSRIGALFGL